MQKSLKKKNKNKRWNSFLSVFFFPKANGSSQVQFARGHNIVGKTTFYDMESDQSQKHILTACQDRSVRVYNTSTGKHSKTFKGSNSDDGTLIKVWYGFIGIGWQGRRGGGIWILMFNEFVCSSAWIAAVST